MRQFHQRVSILSPSGEHIRAVPCALARAMVEGGTAEIANPNGRIRAIRLIQTASTHAARIGGPSPGRIGGTSFTRWVRLEVSGARIIEHHPRCLWTVSSEPD